MFLILQKVGIAAIKNDGAKTTRRRFYYQVLDRHISGLPAIIAFHIGPERRIRPEFKVLHVSVSFLLKVGENFRNTQEKQGFR
jgi:hypothetical protein